VDDRDLPLEGVSLLLKKIMGQCDQLLAIQGSFLADERMDAIGNVRAKLEKIYTNLEDGKLVDDRNDVDSLLNINAIKWDFHNEIVDHYRAVTKTRVAPVFNDWYVPEYFSETPLPIQNPLTAKPVQVHIKLLVRDYASNKGDTHIVVSITKKVIFGLNAHDHSFGVGHCWGGYRTSTVEERHASGRHTEIRAQMSWPR